MPEGSVEFAKVSYTLPDGRALLHGIDLRLEPGTTTALLGRSGSGKTTLLRMVNGLVQPASGVVRVNDADVAQADAIALRRGIGYVIQEVGLFPHMSIARNASMALELAGIGRAESQRRMEEMLRLVGLDVSFAARYPWQLSGGQRQRVGLARALASDPAILLMDEPFGALDPLTRAEMQTMLRELLARVGKTALLVTHDLDEALYLAQRVIFLVEGGIVADLRPEEVERAEHPFVREYVRAVRHEAAP